MHSGTSQQVVPAGTWNMDSGIVRNMKVLSQRATTLVSNCFHAAGIHPMERRRGRAAPTNAKAWLHLGEISRPPNANHNSVHECTCRTTLLARSVWSYRLLSQLLVGYCAEAACDGGYRQVLVAMRVPLLLLLCTVASVTSHVGSMDTELDDETQIVPGKE